MTGEQMTSLDGKVTPLTDVVYRKIMSENPAAMTDTQLLQRMDELASLLVDDIDGDGAINYADLLVWSRVINASRFIGDDTLLTSVVR